MTKHFSFTLDDPYDSKCSNVALEMTFGVYSERKSCNDHTRRLHTYPDNYLSYHALYGDQNKLTFQ